MPASETPRKQTSPCPQPAGRGGQSGENPRHQMTPPQGGPWKTPPVEYPPQRRQARKRDEPPGRNSVKVRRCWKADVTTVEISNEVWVGDVVSRDLGPLLWTVSFPINQVLEPPTTPSRTD